MFFNFLGANFAPTTVPKWAHKLRKSRARAGTPSDRAMGYLPGSGENSIKVYSCGSWTVLVASWKRLGAILGASWGVLGSSWRVLEVFGGILGRLEGVLGEV